MYEYIISLKDLISLATTNTSFKVMRLKRSIYE